MGDMYNACSSPPTGGGDRRSSDDISVFLHQILLHSTSASSTGSSFMTNTGPQLQSFAAPLSIPRESHPHRLCESTLVKDGISGLDSGEGVNVGFFQGNVKGNGANASSLSIGGASENEADDYDCESEEALEALAEEAQAKPAPPRGSSKRSRAAEVHNLSEKRRRSRINEKMKALQNLIPNSNKTDKASMLDEAIEYLKQLQLQVQMLSMRNGISLHPMCLPGMLQPVQLSQYSRGFGEENVSQHMNIAGSLPLNQENPEQIIFDLPNQCAISNQLSVPNIINSETSFGMESSIRAHFGPFPLLRSSEEICREDILPHQQLNADHLERIPSEFEMEARAAASLPFVTQSSSLKNSSSLSASMMGRDQNESLILKNMEYTPIISPYLQRIQTERSASSDEIKKERQDIRTK
ncbi:transcription factor SPATULA isoform X2 [Manihot esculenta]|uniref:BHLH domain-containing protein n=1 Tax=Manihot esculenta TaxID=3983 RepID=A0A2C9UVC2_MANES|nr:transcription factor SPATULA isoform X2 [Manihot esculenta]OAY35468.1 hypothetical protein MANES_12G104100v8 [Manihot esculenta]